MAEQPQLEWFKSSYSGSPNNECVECANLPQSILVRDSKTPNGPHLTFSQVAWGAFAFAVRTGTLRRN
ncbi:DUF397 domain-containing protein [Streptomyces sp. 5-6(2022)]|uniref:DUF397 domain-containing protein n=1 Tax=Streptomyces sp. 5-6(2022) TaxID=2936510 RepID=UPI0023B8BBB2|nr:DUF397 domain-containing protein [Streptomyces sp. 5-6(2022)]